MALPPATPRQISLPVALSIAGSDSGGGAGIQADLLTFAAHEVFGTTAVTCLTAQNPAGVSRVHAAPAAVVRAQIESVCRFFPVRAAKTGMLFNSGIIGAVAGYFASNRHISLVIDPVMVATSGAVLLRPQAIAALTRALFPLATLITPNLDEAAVLLGRRPDSGADLVDAAVALAEQFGAHVLLKGGHLRGKTLCDALAGPAGLVRMFSDERIRGVDTHGSGCTLSAAITANLARGRSLEDSVARARTYLRRGLRHPLKAGKRFFIAH